MRKENLINQYKKSPVTFTILLIIIVYFIIMSLSGGTTDPINLVRFGALFPPFIFELKEYYRFISPIFIHIGIMHLFFNSYALYIFGRQIEKLMGHVKYLLFFLLCGIGGNLVTYFVSLRSVAAYKTISAGASGSLFGILGAFVYLTQHHKNMMTPEGRKSIFKLLGINLILTIISPSISITAHFRGLVIGYLLSYIFIK